MPGKWRRRLIVMGIVTIAFVIGSNVQQQLGIEFSLEQLVRMSRYLLVGGAVQMLLAA